MQWISRAKKELTKRPNLTFLPRTTVFGHYDHNTLAAVQKLGEPGEILPTPRERLWHFRAKHVVLATGAHERPFVFANNDRPGILLAGAVRQYVDHFAVLPGRRAVVFTNNDRAYQAAISLHAAGAEVAAVVDSRSNPSGAIVDAVREKNIPILSSRAVIDTRGGRRISAVAVAPLSQPERKPGFVTWLPCDLLSVSAGYSPVVHLHCQGGGKLQYDESLAGFRPAKTVGTNGVPRAAVSVGACAAHSAGVAVRQGGPAALLQGGPAGHAQCGPGCGFQAWSARGAAG
jgi:sarcosine oxidase subunit alpha